MFRSQVTTGKFKIVCEEYIDMIEIRHTKLTVVLREQKSDFGLH